VHAAVGSLFELSAVPAPLAIGLQVAFEAVENHIKPPTALAWPDARPDGWQNQVGDVASFIAGYYGARAIKSDEVGRFALTALVATAGAIWTYNLFPSNHGVKR